MKLKRTDLLFFGTVSSGLFTACLYYGQPLIPLIADEFDISLEKAGSIAYLTQAGCAGGLLFVTALAGITGRRLLIVFTAFASSVFFLTAAVSPTFIMLQISSVLTGCSSVIPLLTLLSARKLQTGGRHDPVVYLVMSSIFTGMLVSHTLSGAIGYLAGWRGMFLLAALLSFGVSAAAYKMLTPDKPVPSVSYKKLIRPVFTCLNTMPVLQAASLINTISFAVVSAFWVTMIFYLSQPDFHFNSLQTGLFGLAGAAGVAGVAFSTRFSDLRGGSTALFIALLCELAGLSIFAAAADNLLLFTGGVILLHAGHQVIQITNQARASMAQSSAYTAVNTAYMITYFMGGALGALAVTAGWPMGGWIAFCTGGIVLVLINFLIVYITKRVI